MQMNMMFELIQAQKRAKEAQAMAEIEGIKVKPRYEYDSDEDVANGTWEHRKRTAEMTATRGQLSFSLSTDTIADVTFDACACDLRESMLQLIFACVSC